VLISNILSAHKFFNTDVDIHILAFIQYIIEYI